MLIAQVFSLILSLYISSSVFISLSLALIFSASVVFYFCLYVFSSAYELKIMIGIQLIMVVIVLGAILRLLVLDPFHFFFVFFFKSSYGILVGMDFIDFALNVLSICICIVNK